MEIEHKNINEALNFYDISEEKYKEKCYQCIERINKNAEILEKFNNILNFVFNIRECDDYTNLSEETSLQRKIKAFLINGGIIYNGYGEIKNEEIIS